jgi:two-component system, NtrC family, nitrogen regulation response regulator GlnG
VKQRVFLIDNNKDCLDIMEKQIGSWGYEVVPCVDARCAVEETKRQESGAIVMDYSTSGANGVELLMKIRSQHCDIPTVVLSNCLDLKAMQDANKLKIVAFIPRMSAYVNTIDMLKTTLDLIFSRVSA